MHKRLLVAGVALAALALAGCTSTTTYTPSNSASSYPSSTMPTTSGPQGTAVAIRGLAFSPATLQVSPGATVTWTNHDTVQHTVTADDGSFDSGVLNPGDSYTHTAPMTGVLAYHCKIHSTMTGTVAVLGTSLDTGTSQPSMPSPQPSQPSSPGYP